MTAHEPLHLANRITASGRTMPIYTPTHLRRLHTYAIGQTGVGKSILLLNSVLQDIKEGRGATVIDPHGDVATHLLELIPPWRVNDTVYLDPSDTDHPFSFNILDGAGKDTRHLVASQVVASMKSIWRDSFGPRMEYIFNHTIRALLDRGDSTLLGVQKMYTDKDYRNQVVSFIQDPAVRSYWIDEFSNYTSRQRSEFVAPIQNKIGAFTQHPIVRNIIGQVKSKFSPRDAMDSGKIVIINLSKGLLGSDASNLLGSLIIASYTLGALSRADTKEYKRRDHFLYVDEFHNYATDSFAEMLSEARKYRLSLHLFHQFTAQLSDRVREAIIGNVGTVVAFRCGATDGAILEEVFDRDVLARQFTNLRPFHAFIKTISDGDVDSYKAVMLQPPRLYYNKSRSIIRQSREAHARKREVVEDKIERFLSPMD